MVLSCGTYVNPYVGSAHSTCLESKSLFRIIKGSIGVTSWLALLTSDHGVVGLNSAGGEILPKPKQSFIAQNLSCTPFHCLDITEILLKGMQNPNTSIKLGSVRVAERLALPTSDHGVAGSNPAGGEILLRSKRRFIAQSLSYSPFHRLEMTEILLKGRKTLTHPYIHQTIKGGPRSCDLLKLEKSTFYIQFAAPTLSPHSAPHPLPTNKLVCK